MKIQALLAGVVLAASVHAQGIWIQVLSAKKEVPAAFLKNLERKQLDYKIVDEGDSKKVWVGHYKSKADAVKAMHFIRCQVASDAFIIATAAPATPKTAEKQDAKKPVDPVAKSPKVEEVPQQLAVVGKHATVIKEEPAQSKPVEAEVQKPVDTKMFEKPIVVTQKAAPKPAEEPKPEAQQASQPCQCICDNRALKKVELRDAVAFYRNSPDYRFTYKTEAIPGF